MYQLDHAHIVEKALRTNRLVSYWSLNGRHFSQTKFILSQVIVFTPIFPQHQRRPAQQVTLDRSTLLVQPLQLLLLLLLLLLSR